MNVVPFRIPPLRERIEDILLIAGHFLNKFSRKYNREHQGFDIDIQKILKGYNWPGNVRELENILERSVLLSTGNTLDIDLPSATVKNMEHSFADMPTIQNLERRYIKFILKKTDGKLGGRDGASEILGLNRTTLYSRMKKLGMR